MKLDRDKNYRNDTKKEEINVCLYSPSQIISPEEFVNLAETFIRKVIKMAKHISYFKQLHKDDQISLLKG